MFHAFSGSLEGREQAFFRRGGVGGGGFFYPIFSKKFILTLFLDPPSRYLRPPLGEYRPITSNTETRPWGP